MKTGKRERVRCSSLVRLAGLSALETDYARIGVGAQFGARQPHCPQSGPITPGSSLAFPIPVGRATASPVPAPGRQ
jgi:hypothetical protein